MAYSASLSVLRREAGRKITKYEGTNLTVSEITDMQSTFDCRILTPSEPRSRLLVGVTHWRAHPVAAGNLPPIGIRRRWLSILQSGGLASLGHHDLHYFLCWARSCNRTSRRSPACSHRRFSSSVSVMTGTIGRRAPSLLIATNVR